MNIFIMKNLFKVLIFIIKKISVNRNKSCEEYILNDSDFRLQNPHELPP